MHVLDSKAALSSALRPSWPAAAFWNVAMTFDISRRHCNGETASSARATPGHDCDESAGLLSALDLAFRKLLEVVLDGANHGYFLLRPHPLGCI